MITLRQMRESKNLTLLEVASQLGYSYPSSYAKIENGQQQLKSKQIAILAKII